MINEVASMDKKYYILTFGCQANERDSETIAGILEKMGYVFAAELSQADIILFNTCCIREKAENKVLSQVGELKDLKAENPDLIIGICGCMVQQEKVAEKIHQRAPHVDLIFGTHNLDQLPELIKRIEETKTPQTQILSDLQEIREGLPVIRGVPFKARVNITYGCNNFCTYCIVPYVRGREKSRELQYIVQEVKDLVADGVVEVILLGQNVNSYGKTLEPPVTFAHLLEQLNAIEGLKRIRYLTSHPRDFNVDLIKTISGLAKVCPHFHLPLQSGSNQILQKMNRGYTREHYKELVETVRQYVPSASITTDIIVGFPGETDKDFQDTIDLVEELRFDSAFTFIYSARTGTPAAKMSDQIPLTVKKTRLQQLMQVQNQISLAINYQLKGQVVKVLVDGCSKKDQEILEGRTATNKSILFPGPKELIGKFVEVELTDPQTWILKGKLI